MRAKRADAYSTVEHAPLLSPVEGPAVPPTPQQYVYKVVEVAKVTDGDTYWLRLDVGFRQLLLINARLSGWDCPERFRGSTYEREMGSDALAFAGTWFRAAAGLDIWVQTYKDPDNFGRWLTDVWASNQGVNVSDLGEYLAERQLAVPWPKRWRDVHDQGSTE